MIAALVLLLCLLTSTSPAHAADVSGDDDRDVFVGSGSSLLLDRSFTGGEGQRRRIAACPGCRWSLTGLCYGESRDGSNRVCIPQAHECPPDQRSVAVWFGEPGEPMQVTGTTCLGPRGPRTVSSVAAAVDDLVLTAVPPLQPDVAPAPVLTGIAARARSGQPQRLGSRTMNLGGSTVVLDATVEWHWLWGDGTSTRTTSPVVRKTWRTPMRTRVTVNAQWRGWFSVDGLGPFPVSGAVITQQSSVPVNVHPARTVLVRPGS